MQKVLIVDDDPALIEEVRAHLESAGYLVSSAGDGPSALAKIEREDFDLIILDVVLPNMRGFDLCRQIRLSKPVVPILFLSGQSDPIDKTLGLELGADDYITKPFASHELIARVRAVLRRYTIHNPVDPTNQSKQNKIELGEIVIDFDSMTLSRNGVPIPLTATEFRLVAYLAYNRGRILSRDQLREEVWGNVAAGFDQTVTSTFSRARAKIEENPRNPRYLLTSRGFGYSFAKE